ncbi:MAG: right-handed parallel beta-helix repeat-containing protein [Planctomycetia bacterium]|nr:right-handed parallel beta-helix repeat-containing protein [Planctomycetia bacterium]
MTVLFVLFVLAGVSPCGATEWHVTPLGDDAALGTRDRPFATLERARDAGRQTPGPRVIHVLPGIHHRTQTLELDRRDAGLTIRGAAVAAGLPLSGLHAGMFVATRAFRPAREAPLAERLSPAARDHVLMLDLATLGITHAGPFPDVFHDGGGILDLYVNDRPLPLARWPNDGPTTMQKVLDRGDSSRSARRPGAFVARDNRVGRWNVADGLWLEGYWRVPWQPEAIRVASIDAASRTITFAEPVAGGIGSKYAPRGSKGDGKEPWWAVNLLEEIDRPGEWCIHFPSKTLFFWPTEDFLRADDAGGVYLADVGQPLVRIRDGEGITIEGLMLEGGLGDGVVIEGGSHTRVVGCTLRNRRESLTPCHNFAIDNEIHHVGLRQKTYAAAIHVGEFGAGPRNTGSRDAVGCLVAHNLLRDLPHAAVLYTGNDNLFECNEVCRVALTSRDVGGFYSVADWTTYGNILRHNFVHSCPRANAFYVDDGDSGDTIIGNVVVNAACGPFVGGGHFNTVRNNIVVDSPIGIHLDARGVARGYDTSGTHRGRLTRFRTDLPPWSDRYPALHSLTTLDAGLPHGNVVNTNVTIDCGMPLRRSGRPEHLADNQIEEPLVVSAAAAAFADAAAGDFSLRADSAIYTDLPAFEPIPFTTIGLRSEAPNERRQRRATTLGATAAGADDGVTSLDDIRATDARGPSPR